jgi:hypothetical protein
VAGYGCGSSSSGSTDGVALCNQFCNKFNQLCAGDASPIPITLNCATECTPTMVSQKTTNCTNSSAIISATQACLNNSTTCDALTTCNIPTCQSTTGGAGTSGGAGTTGSGGHAGTTGAGGSSAAGNTGAGGITGLGGFGGNLTGIGGFGGNIVIAGTCADLLACCNTASGTAKSTCMTAYSLAMPSGDTACGAVLGQIKASTCP